MSLRRTFYNIFFRLSPILIVVLIELSLRFWGVGESYVLFQKSEDAQRYEINSSHYKRYLSERQFEDMDLLYQDFPIEKETDTYRVFLISDHTIISAFPGSNKEELLSDFKTPDGKTVDIIQLALPFTNSFAIKEMLRSTKKYDPDACIVFTGQNEFYGLPKKSVWMRDIKNYWGLNTYVRMKNHRIIQVLDRFLFLSKDISKEFPPLDIDEWALETDFVDYKEISSNFKKNLISSTKNLDFPIFYVNLPVNIKQQPYRSYFDDKELLDKNFVQECSQLLEKEDTYTLGLWLEDLYAWEPKTAIYYYCKAMIEERNKETTQAVEDYWKAVKLDAFKVRMDQDFRNLLMEVAKESPNKIIDLEAYLLGDCEKYLDCEDYFKNGLELNEKSKKALGELIRDELTEYFSGKK